MISMTARQKTFILDLLERAEDARQSFDPESARFVEVTWKTMRIAEDPEERQITKHEASQIIDRLLPLAPKPAKAPSNGTPYPEVPKGRYGINDTVQVPGMPGVNGKELRFFRVTRSKKGFTYLAEVKDVTNSGRPRHIPIKHSAEKRRILEAILAHPGGLNESMALYGRHLGQCGKCSHTLTDDYSRLAGLGPHCRYLLGIPTDPALVAEVKALAPKP